MPRSPSHSLVTSVSPCAAHVLKRTLTHYVLQVYISDLSSHHGTHVLRPGDTVSTMLSPDRPNVLADGDTITFGKTVGREDGVVRPIIAKVRLLFTTPTPVVASASSTPPSPTVNLAAPHTPAADGAAARSSPPTSSGRYGIYTPAMSSGSDSSSEDDVEEIPPPVASAPRPCAPMLPWTLPGSQFADTHHRHSHTMHHVPHTHRDHRTPHAVLHPWFAPSSQGRLGLLRRILPRLGSVEELASVSTRTGGAGGSGSGARQASPISISSQSRSRSPSVVEVPRSDIHVPSEPADESLVEEHQQDVAQDADEDMDLESEAPSEYPSHPLQREEPQPLPHVLDPFGGLPAAHGGLALLMASEQICTPERDEEEAEVGLHRAVDEWEEWFEAPNEVVFPTPQQLAAVAPAAVPIPVPVPAPEAEVVVDGPAEADKALSQREEALAERIDVLQSTCEDMVDNIIKQRRDMLEEPFKLLQQSVGDVAERTTDQREDALAERLESLKMRFEELAERMTSSSVNSSVAGPSFTNSAAVPAPAPVPSAAAQAEDPSTMITDLRTMLTGTLSRLLSADASEHPPAPAALDELRKTAAADVQHELAAIRAARAEAEAAVRRVVRADEVSICALAARCGAHAAVQGGVVAGTKRKRDELAEDDGQDEVVAVSAHQRRVKRPRVELAKRFVAGVVKTTAIAAVGAAATWTALAYS